MLRAASTTGPASLSPGRSPRREIGPLTHTAALKSPLALKTGALTLATPSSRSATLSAQPQRRISSRTVSATRSVYLRRSSAHASKTFPADPRAS